MKKLIILALLCAPMWAQLTYTRTAGDYSYSGLGAVDLGATTAAGDFLVFVCNYPTGRTPSISDNQGGSWTLANSQAGSTRALSVWYSKVAATSVVRPTCNTGGGSDLAVVDIYEFTGQHATTPFDVTIKATGSGANPSVGTITTTKTNQTIFAACGLAVAAAYTAGSGFTYIANHSFNGAQYRSATTATGYSVAFTGGTGEWECIAVAFSSTTSASGSARRRVTLIQ